MQRVTSSMPMRAARLTDSDASVVAKLFGDEEPEDSTSDSEQLVAPTMVANALAIDFTKAASGNSSFARTVSSSDSDSDSDDMDNNNNSSNRQYHSDMSPLAELESAIATSNQDAAECEALRDANARLSSQVADLTSALLVRDMEIASLQERCQLLLTSVEQQDAVIAKIYAAAADAPSASSAIAIPTRASLAIDAHRHRQGAHMGASTGSSSTSSHVPLRSHRREITNKHELPSRAFESIWRDTDAGASATTAAEPARELLAAHLESIGYEQQSATDALHALSDSSDVLPPTGSADGNDNDDVSTSASVGMLDRLLFPSPLKSEPLFGSVTPSRTGSTSGTNDTSATSDSANSLCAHAIAASPDVRRVHQSPFTERRGSFVCDDDVAKSAGFLRKANRKLSGRLTVSDFGLLGDADAPLLGSAASSSSMLSTSSSSSASVASSSASSSAQPEDASESDALAANDGGAATTISQRRTASQRNLFADVDAATHKRESRAAAATAASTTSAAATDPESDACELTYAAFLERISLPASRDLLHSIRVFVGSVLGPRGDGKPPRASDYIDYDFYGPHEFTRRYEQFFRKVDAALASHAAWRHASEALLLRARDGVEKYVMDKLADVALNELPQCLAWKAEDEKLFRRMKLLSFVTPDMLDIKACMRNEVVWSMAEDELRRINAFRAPGDKINCIVRCCSVIFSVLNLARGDSSARPGADDFLPVFIYIVLHSQIPRLCSNCEYIAAFRNPADLMSKAGYCFVNLRSAIEFINVLDASMLSISTDEFDRLYSERERLLQAH